MNWTDQQACIVGSHEYGALVTRAWADPAFHELLLKEPKKAFKEALGVEPNPDFKFLTAQDKPGTYTLVIPSPPVPPLPLGGPDAGTCNTAVILFTIGCTGSC